MMYDHDETTITPSMKTEEKQQEQQDQSQEHDHGCDDCGEGVCHPPIDVVSGGQEQKNENMPKQLSGKNIAVMIAGLAVVAMAGLGGYMYKHSSSDPFVQRVGSWFPLPAIMVGRHVVTYPQYYAEQQALTDYFASVATEEQGAPERMVIDGMVQEALVNKAVVETLASNYGITVDQTQVRQFYDNFVETNANADETVMAQQLEETFHWTPAEFRTRIIEPIVLSSQVSTYIDQSEFFQAPIKRAIEEAHARIVEGGEDFLTVANALHEEKQIQLDGDLGFIKISNLPAAWADVVKGLELNQVSDVIELPQGYAVFQVTEHVKTGKEEDQLHVLVMTLPKQTLDKVVSEYLDRVHVRVFIK